MATLTKYSTNNFTIGLVTDAVLPTRDVAYRRLQNWQINPDGSISKRLGLTDINITGAASGAPIGPDDTMYTSSKEWEVAGNRSLLVNTSVGKSGGIWTMLVQVLERTDAGWERLLTTGAYKLTAYSVDYTTDVKHLYFPVAGGLTRISGGATITSTNVDVRCWDIWGVDDGLAINERPAVLTSKHLYNLFNQGWTVDMLQAWRVGVPAAWPSNSDIPYYSKAQHTLNASAGMGHMVAQLSSAIPVSIANTLAFDVTKLATEDYQKKHGDAPAVRGHYRIKLTSRGFSRGGVAGVANTDFAAFNAAFGTSYDPADLTDDDDTSSYLALEYWAGRMFLVPVAETVSPEPTAPLLGDKIFFTTPVVSTSDTATGEKDVLHVGPIKEPTVEDFFQTPADGGSININGMRNPVALKTVGDLLVIVAEEGIWALNSIGSVFQPYNISYTKLSDVGCKAADSVAVSGDELFFYGTDRQLHKFNPREGLNTLSLLKVHSKVSDVTEEALPFVQLSMDRILKTVTVWLPGSVATGQYVSYKKGYTYNQLFDSWTEVELNDANRKYIGFVTEVNKRNHSYDALAIGPVHKSYRGGKSDIVLHVPDLSATYHNVNDIGYSEFTSLAFTDFSGSIDSVAETTELLLMQDLARDKAARDLVSYHYKTEEVSGASVVSQSACTASVLWDFEGSDTGVYASTPQGSYVFQDNLQLNRTDATTVTNYTKLVAYSTLRVGGNGKSARVQYRSNEINRDCILLGFQFNAIIGDS